MTEKREQEKKRKKMVQVYVCRKANNTSYKII